MQRKIYAYLILVPITLLELTYGYYLTSLIKCNNIKLGRYIDLYKSNRIYAEKDVDITLGSDLNISNNINPVITNKRVVIGSVPEFAIENDNTIETPIQRFFVYTHFAISIMSIAIASSRIQWNDMTSYIYTILAIISSIILGDLGTGIFHWSVDNYGSLKTPIFGSVCAAFQGHHKTPWTITFRSFVNNVYKISFGTIPALLLTNIFIHDSYSKIFFTLFINWWLISQEFHKYSHMKNNIPSIIKYLQNSSIILSRKEHGLHHNSPFEGHYCILNGICNPILDNTKFFRHLEKLVYKLTGNKPITWLEDKNIESQAMSTSIF